MLLVCLAMFGFPRTTYFVVLSPWLFWGVLSVGSCSSGSDCRLKFETSSVSMVSHNIFLDRCFADIQIDKCKLHQWHTDRIDKCKVVPTLIDKLWTQFWVQNHLSTLYLLIDVADIEIDNWGCITDTLIESTIAMLCRHWSTNATCMSSTKVRITQQKALKAPVCDSLSHTHMSVHHAGPIHPWYNHRWCGLGIKLPCKHYHLHMIMHTHCDWHAHHMHIHMHWQQVPHPTM